MAKTTTKAKEPVQEEPKKDNTQMLSLSAEIAIDNLFINLEKPTFDDIVVFAADICLRTANVIKGNVVGDTEQEKMANAIALIQKVATDSVNKPAPTDIPIAPADIKEE